MSTHGSILPCGAVLKVMRMRIKIMGHYSDFQKICQTSKIRFRIRTCPTKSDMFTTLPTVLLFLIEDGYSEVIVNDMALAFKWQLFLPMLGDHT